MAALGRRWRAGACVAVYGAGVRGEWARWNGGVAAVAGLDGVWLTGGEGLEEPGWRRTTDGVVQGGTGA